MVSFEIPYPKNRSVWNKRFGMNSLYAGKHWSVRKSDADFWHRLVRSELVRQNVSDEIFRRPVRIAFFWNDRLDCDNHAYMGKMIVDAIRGWLIDDDDKKHVRSVEHSFHDGDHVLVVVEEWRG